MTMDTTVQQLGASIINLVDKKTDNAINEALSDLNDKLIGGEEGKTLDELIQDYVEEAVGDIDLSSYATTSYVTSAINGIGLDSKLKPIIDDEKRLYEGVNLEEKFASEIANYASKYAWLQARKNSGNYEGINIGDYFYVPMSAGAVGDKTVAAQTFKCRIVGLDTYKGAGNPTIGNMIYCISDEVMNTPLVWNPVNNNNGTSTVNHPWLASAIYAYLNGVNNYTTSAYNNEAHGVNAANKGILQRLPNELQSVLVTKRSILEKKYSASGLLKGGTDWSWEDMGKLWLPSEIEVYGTQIRGNLCQTEGWWNPEAGLSIQFPWFANNCNHRCKKDGNGARRGWWLSSVGTFWTSSSCYVSGDGVANSGGCSRADIYVPLCFQI